MLPIQRILPTTNRAIPPGHSPLPHARVRVIIRVSSTTQRGRPQEVGSLSGSLLGRIEWNENDSMDRTVNVVAGQRMEKDSTDLVYRTHNPLVEGPIPSGPTYSQFNGVVGNRE